MHFSFNLYTKQKIIHLFIIFKENNSRKSFRNRVLFFACITDIIVILLFSLETLFYSIKDFPFAFIFHSIIGLGGVTLSYLSLIIWYKISKNYQKKR